MSHQSLHKLSKKGNFVPQCSINPYINYLKKENFLPIYPINHYISCPKKEILLPIYPINSYVSYPKKETLTSHAPHQSLHKLSQKGNPNPPHTSHQSLHKPSQKGRPSLKGKTPPQALQKGFPKPWQNNPIGLAIRPISFTNRVRTTVSESFPRLWKFSTRTQT